MIVELTAIVCFTAIVIVYILKIKCKHHWEKVETINVYDNYRKNDVNCIPAYKKFVMQCKKCGKVKIIKSE